MLKDKVQENGEFHKADLINAQSRIEYFDIAKGMGILSIILGHMGVEGVDRIVFTFHVPLFFLISGYFISRKTTFVDYAKKRIRALLVPYAFTSVLLIIAEIPIGILKGQYSEIGKKMRATFVAALYGSGANVNKTILGISPIGAIWFLLALLWAILLVKSIINKKYGKWIILVVAVSSYLTSFYIWLPWDIQAGGTAALFVYVGCVLREKNFEVEKENWKLFICGIVILFLEVICNIRVSVVSNYFKYTIVSIIGAMMISYSVLYISRWLEMTKWIKKVLKFYGENSIIILCFHLVELNNVPWRRIIEYFNRSAIQGYWGYLLVFLGKIFFVTISTYIVLRISWLRKIFVK